MKKSNDQLQRLLRAAAAARREATADLGTVPDARWLLHQREGQSEEILLTLRPVLRGGLAVACLLLMMTLLINVRQIEHANRDLFAISTAVLTHVSTP